MTNNVFEYNNVTSGTIVDSQGGIGYLNVAYHTIYDINGVYRNNNATLGGLYRVNKDASIFTTMESYWYMKNLTVTS